MAPNRLARRFRVDEPDRAWVRDVTFIATRRGRLYLAVLLDLYSRRIVGWSMSERNDTALVASALEMALAQHGMQMSLSRKGGCWDNAVAESFFATLEFELIEQRVFATRDEVRSASFEFIEVFYKRQRAHQTFDYKTPAQVEQEYRLVA